jgi:hypothetical protein
MPSDPIECRTNALRCMELSDSATDSQLKAILKNLADNWLKRATELECAQALRMERGKSLPPGGPLNS